MFSNFEFFFSFFFQLIFSYQGWKSQKACQNSNTGKTQIKLLHQNQSGLGLPCMSRPFLVGSLTLFFYVFSHRSSAITFLFLILANCVPHDSCTEKLAPISPKGLKFVVKIDFCTLIENLQLTEFSQKF